ncbi:MAG: putative quinol monooxygenase [Burkholderiaceae bacterium]
MIAVVAKIKVKQGSADAFVATANELAAASRAEPGCLEYALWRTEDPDTFAFLERYQDEAAVEFHRKSDHFRQIGKRLGEHMEGRPEISRLFSM